MRRLVLFVEGDGDVEAVPILVKRLLTEFALWDSVQLDKAAFRIGGVENVSGKNQERWGRRLNAALKRHDVGGILVILDGDARRWEGKPFCAAEAARELTDRARETGAGSVYSLGVVFACREFESWLLAGIESLAGQRLSDGRPGVRAGATAPKGDLEKVPRGAKEAIGKLMPSGYKETLDQAELTSLVDIGQIRQRGLRSFSRLEVAIQQLAQACKTGVHIATPPSSE